MFTSASKRRAACFATGIPNYRFPKDILDEEVRSIEQAGVEIHCGVEVGADISLSELRSQFDAVYVAIGAHGDKKVGMPGRVTLGAWCPLCSS